MMKFLIYYVISGLFALFIMIINSYVLYQLFIYYIFDIGIMIKKSLLIIFSLYVIILNEISRRTNRWSVVINLIKGERNIRIQKVDLFIFFSFSLSFYYITFVILGLLFYGINEYLHLPIHFNDMFFTSIKYIVFILSIIPLFKLIKKYRQQSRLVKDIRLE